MPKVRPLHRGRTAGAFSTWKFAGCFCLNIPAGDVLHDDGVGVGVAEGILGAHTEELALVLAAEHGLMSGDTLGALGPLGVGVRHDVVEEVRVGAELSVSAHGNLVAHGPAVSGGEVVGQNSHRRTIVLY